MKSEKFYENSSNMMLLLLLNRGSLRIYPLIALTFILIIIPFIAKIVANNRSGGLGVSVTNNLLCLQPADLATNDIELLWLELYTNSKTVLVGVCYLTPPPPPRSELR